MIKLGTKAREKETGFNGVVTARAEYLYDRPRVLVESIDSTGRPIEWWYDESRLEVIEEDNKVIINNKNIKAPNEILNGKNDHRIVMALSIMLSVYGGMIEGVEAVNKSYPSFFDDLKSLGVEGIMTYHNRQESFVKFD